MGDERVNRPENTTQPRERGRAVVNLTKVRTVFTPGKVIEVSERELVDLERQGLIYSRATAGSEHEAIIDDEPTDKKDKADKKP
jgi:hypothetical protein